jgi:Holliday junction resolvase RusA-like endonuclease
LLILKNYILDLIKNSTVSSRTKRKITLNITPQTHVRATQNDSIFFRIPREKLRPAGLKRLLRLEKYNQYKVDLLAEAKIKRFELPPSGLSVTFYIPVPQSWSQKKKTAHHGLLHQSKPDLDNCAKAFFDGLVAEDKFIANITLTKRWVDFPEGWIECAYEEVEMKEELIQVPLKE